MEGDKNIEKIQDLDAQLQDLNLMVNTFRKYHYSRNIHSLLSL